MKTSKIIKPLLFIFVGTIVLSSLVSCQKKLAAEEHVHSKTHFLAKEATCQEEGNIEYWYCSQCKKYYRDRDGAKEISKEETILPMTEHTLVEDEPLAPTCESGGLTKGVHCSVCHLVLEEQQRIEPLQHEYNYEHLEWSWNQFTSAGVILTCRNNEQHKTRYPACISSQTISPTCTDAGKTVYTAIVEINHVVYQDVKEDILLPIGHNFDLENIIWVWEEEKVSAQIPCLNDLTHMLYYTAAVSKTTTSPTCLSDGMDVLTASISVHGQTYTDQKEIPISALGHQYDYNNIQWCWKNYDIVSATIFCTNDSTHTLQYDATITTSITPASCIMEGNITYTAIIEVNGQIYRDQRVEVITTTEHDIDFDSYEWEWEDYSTATLVLHCKNDYTHIVSYSGTIIETITPSTCVKEGKIEYFATAIVQDRQYESKKEKVLPIDPNAHDYDYQNPIFQWQESFDTYNVTVKVPCKCGNDFLLYSDISLDVDTKPSTFEEAGYIKYTASVEILDTLYEDVKEFILPIKQGVSTEEEFLEGIQHDTYELVLFNDITIQSSFVLSGEYSILDLNQYTLYLQSNGSSIESSRCRIQNGNIITEDILMINHTSNFILDTVCLLGGFAAYDSKAFIRNCSITGISSYAVSAYQISEIYIEDTSLYQNTEAAFFYIEGENVLAGSTIVLELNVSLFTTTDAILFEEGLAPVMKKPFYPQKMTVEEYLSFNTDFKSISLTEDFICDTSLQITGKKVILDLNDHHFSVSKEFILQVDSAIVQNGKLEVGDNQITLINTNLHLEHIQLFGKLEGTNSSVSMNDVTLQF